MADLSLEELGALLDEKLRPISARLERLEDMAAGDSRTGLSPKALLAMLGTVIVVLAVVFAGRAILAGGSGPGQAIASGAPRLVAADNFSDPANGLFLDHQQGTASIPPDHASAQWDYAYQGGALAAHVQPPSAPLGGRMIGGSARAANRLTGDFAFEVKAKATALANAALYGLRYFPGSRDFGFGIVPGQRAYEMWEIFSPPFLASKSSAIQPDQGANLLRLEVRGSTVRLFINGQEVDSRQDDAFGARPAAVGLFFDTTAAPSEGTVEVRYSDFKVYALS